MPAVGRGMLNQLIDLPETDRSALFIFVGSRFGPNEVAAEHLRGIAAATRSRFPDLAFHVVVAGSCCAAMREDGFIALGRVDDAVLPLLYQHATMVVIPLTLGTGASLKTAEAFGAGAPVLGTSVAFRGFEVAPGEDCLVQDDLSVWPDRLAELTRDPILSHTLRAGAVRRGDCYDYQSVCNAYLPLAQELATEPLPDASRATAARAKALLSLVVTGWKTGAGRILAPSLESLRLSNPDDIDLRRIEAEVLSSGGPAEVRRSAQLFREAFDAGALPEPSLYGLFKARERLGEVQAAALAAKLAARLSALQAAHQDGDVEVRAALWKRLHDGEHAWVRIVAGPIARLGADVHMDYHYLFSLLETGDGADHALGLFHAQMALEAGFNRFWSLSLIAHHQAALGWVSDAADTLALVTVAAADEDQRRSVLDARLAQSWALFHRRELDECLREVSRLLIDAPDFSGAYYVRAECLRLLARSLDDAVADYEKAEQLGYDPAWCRLHSGRLLAETGRMKDAGARLISAFPGPGDVHKIRCWRDGMIEVSRLGVQHMTLSEMRHLMSEAICLDPENLDLSSRLHAFGADPMAIAPTLRRDHLERIIGSTFQAQDYHLVLAMAHEAHALYSEDPIFAYYAAECLHLLSSDLALAEGYYSLALDLSMEPFWPLMNRAQLRRKLGRLEEADLDLKDALKSARTEPERAQALKSLSDLELNVQGPA